MSEYGAWPRGQAGEVPAGGAVRVRFPQAGGSALPELVVAPAHPAAEGRPGVVFEIRQRADGVRALPVFSSAGRLAQALGPAQPWVALPLQRVRELMGGAGVGLVVLDPAPEGGGRRWGLEDMRALAGRLA